MEDVGKKVRVYGESWSAKTIVRQFPLVTVSQIETDGIECHRGLRVHERLRYVRRL